MENNKIPISFEESEKAETLIEKKILCSNHREGLGYFGIYKGYDKENQLFKVLMKGPENDTNWTGSIKLWKWIIED